MPIAVEFLGNLHKGCDAWPKGGGYPSADTRTGNLASIWSINFQKLLFEKHVSIYFGIKLA
jgi:hypothetical protein